MKKLLCAVLIVAMLVLSLTSFTTAETKPQPAPPLVSADDVFPPVAPEDLQLKRIETLNPKSAQNGTYAEFYEIIDSLNFPQTLPSTYLDTETVYLGVAAYDVHLHVRKTVLISSLDELNCYFSYYFSFGSALKWEREYFEQLKKIDYEKQSVLILSQRVPYIAEPNGIVVDQNRLIVMLEGRYPNTDRGSYFHVLAVDKEKLPATGEDLEIYYCTENPHLGVTYEPDLICFPEDRVVFEKVNEGEKPIKLPPLSTPRKNIKYCFTDTGYELADRIMTPLATDFARIAKTPLSYEVLRAYGDDGYRHGSGAGAGGTIVIRSKEQMETYFKRFGDHLDGKELIELHDQLMAIDYTKQAVIFADIFERKAAGFESTLQSVGLYDGNLLFTLEATPGDKDVVCSFKNQYILIVDQEDLPEGEIHLYYQYVGEPDDIAQPVDSEFYFVKSDPTKYEARNFYRYYSIP